MSLEVEIIHRIMIQERGDRGIEFDNRNHSQIHSSRENVTLEEYARGALVDAATSIFILVTYLQEMG
ncbi:MAG: hypothetical protein ACETWE_07605 [Candidatus Bathyarchaeia archaeon]